MDHCGLQRLNYKWVNRLSRILKDFLEPYLTSEENMSATNEAKESADEATHRYVLRRSGLLMLNHIGKVLDTFSSFSYLHVWTWMSRSLF